MSVVARGRSSLLVASDHRTSCEMKYSSNSSEMISAVCVARTLVEEITEHFCPANRLISTLPSISADSLPSVTECHLLLVCSFHASQGPSISSSNLPGCPDVSGVLFAPRHHCVSSVSDPSAPAFPHLFADTESLVAYYDWTPLLLNGHTASQEESQ